MSHRVILTETAKWDLREIAFYIAEQSKDKEIARQFVTSSEKNAAALGNSRRRARFPKTMYFAAWNTGSFRIRNTSSSIPSMKKRRQ